MVVEMTDGFDVVGEAENGEQAVEMVGSLGVDLVLMDIQMPGIDGIEATRLIRGLPSPPQVLVLSTRESEDFDGPARAAGAIGFVPKSDFGLDTLAELWPEG